MPMQPRPMTPASGPLPPSVVVRMRPALPVCARGVSLSRAWSVGRLALGQADLLDVEPGLYLAQHDVVDAVLVPQPDHGGALAGEHRQAQRGVLLVVPPRGLVVGAGVVGSQQAQVLFVLPPQPG